MLGKNRTVFIICVVCSIVGLVLGFLFNEIADEFIPITSQFNFSSPLQLAKSALMAITVPSKFLIVIFAASYTIYALPAGLISVFVNAVIISVNLKSMLQFNSFVDKIVCTAYTFCAMLSLWMIICAVCRGCKFQRSLAIYARTPSEMILSRNSIIFVGDYVFISGIFLVAELGGQMILSMLR